MLTMPVENPMYQMSEVEKLATNYGKGEATEAQVAAALQLQGVDEAKTVDEMLRRDYTGETGSDHQQPNDWEDVVSVYRRGDLTDQQFSKLFYSVFPNAPKS